jgi:hypothetical protein
MVDINYEAHVEPGALPGRAYPRLPSEMPPGAQGGEIGRGIEYAGEEVQRHVDNVMDQARQTQLTDAHNQLQAASLGLTHDPKTGAFTRQGKDAFGLSDQYLPKYDQMAADIVSKVPDPRAREAAQLAATQVRNHLSEQLDTHELQQHKEFGISTAKASVSLAQETAASNYNHPDIIATNLDHVDASLESLARQQGWSPEELEQYKYAEHVKFHEGVLTNMLADQKVDMAKAYFDHVRGELKPTEVRAAEAAIKAGEVDAAVKPVMAAFQESTSMGQHALDGMLKSGGLDSDQQAKAIAAVERQRADFTYAQRQKFDRPITALETAISEGKVPANARSQADSLYQHGALDQAQHISMLDGIVKAEKKQAADNGDLEYARDAYTNQRPMDPKSAQDKKATNLLFATMTIGVPPGSPGYVNTVGNIAAKTGILPEGAVSWSRASLMGGDPQVAAQAASLLDRVQREAPNAYTAATDPETRALAASINSATSSGANPEAAVELARENAKLSQGQRDQLRQAWNTQTQATLRGVDHEALDANAIRQGLADDPHYATHGSITRTFMGSGVPQPPATMAAEFNQLSHAYFLHTNGNLSQARQLALNDLKATWGVTEVNGKRELMKYAPERMVPGLTADMVKNDIRQQFPDKDVRLTESPETGVSGGKVWNLSAKDEFGAYDVMRDSTGRPLRWQLPEVHEAVLAAQEKQDAQDRDRLVKEQEQRKALEANVMERHGYATH